MMLWCVVVSNCVQGDDFDTVLKPLFENHCVSCHGTDNASAGLSLQPQSLQQRLAEDPALLLKISDAVDTAAMPPDGETPLDADLRQGVVTVLRDLLRQNVGVGKRLPAKIPLQRLNRFQYNNAVRDLFQLDCDVFALPEKLMTRYDGYLQSLSGTAPSQLPDVLQVASHSLAPLPGLEGVKPFPKDLRAEHGFDNQADQLTLSPLLLDSFLRLSVSIVESPDFRAETVGIWDAYFAQPAADTDRYAEVRQRLIPFLRIAFRGPVSEETLNRYTQYALGKMEAGLSFTDGMKAVSAAVLSSPLFLYRSSSAASLSDSMELASRLSFFLWGSGPDEALLLAAEKGELQQAELLEKTVNRMLADPRIQRFLDSFPSQWMQLENTLAATPDPQISPYFGLIPEAPASLQMVLEPLLMFDLVFVEDRPLVELIAPSIIYRSNFLQAWYENSLQPQAVDVNAIVAENQRNEESRRQLRAELAELHTQLATLVDSVRSQLLMDRRLRASEIAEQEKLQPFASWEFNGNLKDVVGGLDLAADGEIHFADGMVILDKSWLRSPDLPVSFSAKTLEIRFQLANPDQNGGGLIGLQGPGDFFDTIVLGERKTRHWISGSDNFRRTQDFADSFEETVLNSPLHLAMVYAEDGTTTLYRNGVPYGKPYAQGKATFPKDESFVLFGLRHVPPQDSRFLSVSIDQARLYDRALTPEEVASAAGSLNEYVSEQSLVNALTGEQKQQRERLLSQIQVKDSSLKQIPPDVDPNQAVKAAQDKFEQDFRTQLLSREFHRLESRDPRFGGIITNAAVLSMTSGPKRTHPVARGVWVIEVIFNDPPEPPPNDVPPLNEEVQDKTQTIREQFAAHRANASCAGCHTKLDPPGFALENFDITGRWRDRYDNGRLVDSSGSLLRKHQFDGVVRFRESLVTEQARFARAFVEHLIRFALGRKLRPEDTLTVDQILASTEMQGYPIRAIIRELVSSELFLQ